jgi:hypothetical protein
MNSKMNYLSRKRLKTFPKSFRNKRINRTLFSNEFSWTSILLVSSYTTIWIHSFIYVYSYCTPLMFMIHVYCSLLNTNIGWPGATMQRMWGGCSSFTRITWLQIQWTNEYDAGESKALQVSKPKWLSHLRHSSECSSVCGVMLYIQSKCPWCSIKGTYIHKYT